MSSAIRAAVREFRTRPEYQALNGWNIETRVDYIAKGRKSPFKAIADLFTCGLYSRRERQLIRKEFQEPLFF